MWSGDSIGPRSGPRSSTSGRDRSPSGCRSRCRGRPVARPTRTIDAVARRAAPGCRLPRRARPPNRTATGRRARPRAGRGVPAPAGSAQLARTAASASRRWVIGMPRPRAASTRRRPAAPPRSSVRSIRVNCGPSRSSSGSPPGRRTAGGRAADYAGAARAGRRPLLPEHRRAGLRAGSTGAGRIQLRRLLAAGSRPGIRPRRRPRPAGRTGAGSPARAPAVPGRPGPAAAARPRSWRAAPARPSRGTAAASFQPRSTASPTQVSTRPLGGWNRCADWPARKVVPRRKWLATPRPSLPLGHPEHVGTRPGRCRAGRAAGRPDRSPRPRRGPSGTCATQASPGRRRLSVTRRPRSSSGPGAGRPRPSAAEGARSGGRPAVPGSSTGTPRHRRTVLCAPSQPAR